MFTIYLFFIILFIYFILFIFIFILFLFIIRYVYACLYVSVFVALKTLRGNVDIEEELKMMKVRKDH